MSGMMEAVRRARKEALAQVQLEFGPNWPETVLGFRGPAFDQVFAALRTAFGDAASLAVFARLLGAKPSSVRMQRKIEALRQRYGLE